MSITAKKHTNIQHLKSSTPVLQFTFNQIPVCSIEQFLTGVHPLFSVRYLLL